MTSQQSPGGDSAGQSDDVDHEAALWDARLRSTDCSPGEREQFRGWIGENPDHSSAFEQLQQGIRLLQAESAMHPHLRAMRNEAAQRRRQGALRRGLVTAGALAASLAGILIYQHIHSPVPEAVQQQAAATILQTSAGERSSARLADGTEIALDTRTRLKVVYTPEFRSVVVEDGRAWFSVAKVASRPFTVETGAQRIVAIGTEFDVRLDEQKLLVTLLEGRVDVLSAAEGTPSTASTWSMHPGEQLVVDRATGATRIGAADVTKATSWRHGKIIFEDTPLSEAVIEMNRYSIAPIVLMNPDLADVQINGMFYTSNPESFLLALQQYFSIEVRRSPNGATELIGRSG